MDGVDSNILVSVVGIAKGKNSFWHYQLKIERKKSN